MRRSLVACASLLIALLAGCSTHRRPPYADDPKLLHYKPTLTDSATILVEKQTRRPPTRPPMPAANPTDDEPLGPPPGEEIRPARAEAPAAAAAPAEPRTETTLLPPPPVDASPVTMPGAAPLPPPAEPVAARELEPVMPPSMPVAAREPDPLPPLPPLAEPLAAREPEPTPEPEPGSMPPVAESTVPPPMPAAVLIPSEPASPAALPGKPRRAVDGDYGHDDDYRWIQGRLERHHRGYYCVRYRDPSEEDPHGGKVRLQDDPRVAMFNEGDVLGVEGGIEHDSGERSPYPRFIVRDVWLVRPR